MPTTSPRRGRLGVQSSTRSYIMSLGPALYWPLDSYFGAGGYNIGANNSNPTEHSGNHRWGVPYGNTVIGTFADSPTSSESTSTDFTGASVGIGNQGLAGWPNKTREYINSLGPAMFWPLAGDATFAGTDYSGNGRNINGTNGGITLAGQLGGPQSEGIPTCTSFDGSDDTVSTTLYPTVWANSRATTFMGWAGRHATVNDAALFGGGVFDSVPFLRVVGGTQNVEWCPGHTNYPTNTVTWTGAWPNRVDHWEHYALVFDEPGDTAKLYINGALVSSQPLTAQYSATVSEVLQLGWWGIGNAWNGSMCEFSVFERALTATEIKNYYLTAQWPWGNGSVRTFTGWAYRDTSTSVDQLFSSLGVFNQAGAWIDTGGNNVGASMNGGTETEVWTNAWPGNGQWVHWAFVFDEPGDVIKLYINGSLVSSQAHTAQYSSASEATNFGLGTSSFDGNPFDGKMAHFAIFERELTAQEINNIWQRRK